MLYERLIWFIRKHPYTPALIYFKKIFHFLTFQTSKLPKTGAKKTKKYDIISMLCTPWEISPIWAYMPAKIPMGHMPTEKRLLRWQVATRSSIPFQLPRCQGERCNRCCHSHFLNVSFSLSYCHENCNSTNKILVNPMSTVHAGMQVIKKGEKYHQHVNIYVAITTI